MGIIVPMVQDSSIKTNHKSVEKRYTMMFFMIRLDQS